MSDNPRQPSSRALSVASSSPGRPSPLSRPHWPWSTYTHRPSSSASSVYTPGGTSSGQQNWDSRSPAATSNTILLSPPSVGKRGSTMTSATYHNSMMEEATIRQWSFSAFEWVVRDVHRLRDFVEGVETTEAPNDTAEGDPDTEYFEVLKESPTIGDGKFKLEIAKTPPPENMENATLPTLRNQLPTLSVYITSLMVDFSNAEYEMSTSMFAAIKCQDDRAGERGARAEWVWEYWHDGWVFRQESEVWECPLPPLSSLLENPRIRETDSFVICVQMHSPVGPFFPQQPAAYYVPRDLLDGLEASLDNPNTGDVQFICLERRDAVDPALPTSNASETFSQSSSHPIGPQTLARKRIIYAHSDILTRRSEYFATMLNSSFAENPSGSLYPGERKIYTIVVEEADFVTIYWLLKFVYANWLLFRKDDDPRQAVDGLGAGWSARGFSTPGAPDEWEWKPIDKSASAEAQISGAVSDAHSIASASSARSNVGGSVAPRDKPSVAPPALQTTGSRTSSASKDTSTPVRPTSSRRSGPPTTPSALSSTNHASSTAASRGAKHVPVPISPPAHYPLSPRQPRQRSHPPSASIIDPHPHPTPPPRPASALSMYQVAHRYAMPGLASLALEHIMSTITPQAGFAILLATSAWEELHSPVEDYVVDKWDEVSISEEFERCCQEVAGGEWGPEGGKTLMALFRRLRSPGIAS
ncbi:hypothetical protein WOLCODRAFT_100015 [Wolfiporia cocos MD-104 SS10]|uniref:BTB domain-containing protein n=1 Tax=Wolfiporia cocos (strain MD-104) TaxID=742152 RepID=A0A2H3JG65_WOLCO|nr:hypothetical protein WOLCODRAFT_100015 [Wolfiporia cocos MD-104 SS10]